MPELRLPGVKRKPPESDETPRCIPREESRVSWCSSSSDLGTPLAREGSRTPSGFIRAKSGFISSVRPAGTFFGRRPKVVAASIFALLVANFAWKLQAQHRAVHKLLEDFDHDHSDRLSPQELRRLLQQHGIRLNVTQLSELFGKAGDESSDAFDYSELASIISFLAGLPAAPERLRDLRDPSWLVDGVLLCIAGIGLAYMTFQTERHHSKWAATALHAAFKTKKMHHELGKLKSEAQECSQKYEELSRALHEKEAQHADQAEIERLKNELEDISKREDVLIVKLKEEIDDYKHQAEVSMEKAEKSMKQAQSIVGCIKGIESFRGAGKDEMRAEGAQQGFETKTVGFSTDLITFGTIEDGKVRTFETGSGRQSQLGQGRDCAYLAVEVGTGKQYALKKYRISNSQQRKSATSDLLALRTDVGSHPNIMKYELVIESAETVFVLMEYIKGRDLFSVVIDTEAGVPESDAKALFRDLTAAVQHLHDNKVIHCDIKPENAMVEGSTNTGTLKLIDFGCSCFLQYQQPDLLLMPMDPYTPPEHSPFGSRPVPNTAADVWRLGCTLFIMLIKAPPFRLPDSSREGYAERTAEDMQFKQFEGFRRLSSQAQDLISKLIVGDPAKRLRTQDILAHPWLSQPG